MTISAYASMQHRLWSIVTADRRPIVASTDAAATTPPWSCLGALDAALSASPYPSFAAGLFRDASIRQIAAGKRKIWATERSTSLTTNAVVASAELLSPISVVGPLGVVPPCGGSLQPYVFSFSVPVFTLSFPILGG